MSNGSCLLKDKENEVTEWSNKRHMNQAVAFTVTTSPSSPVLMWKVGCQLYVWDAPGTSYGTLMLYGLRKCSSRVIGFSLVH